MQIDLNNSIVFKKNENLDLNDSCNIIYGKNGTGKSTLTSIINEQYKNKKDVEIFNGFDNIVGDNKTLNAVILGEKNTEIDSKIIKLRTELEKETTKKQIIEDNINEPKDNSENLWTEWNEKNNNVKKIEKEIEGFYRSSSSEIKNRKDPQIVSTTYNKNDFVKDKTNAKILDDTEKNHLIDIINTKVMIANRAEFPSINFDKLLQDVNNILNKKVSAKSGIVRLDSQEKINFADNGRKIHKKGDVCAFCGNRIDDNVFEELENFFTEDDINDFQKKINNEKISLEENLKKIESLKINTNNFYPSFKCEFNNLNLQEKIDEIQKEQQSFLTQLINGINNKNSELFIESKKLSIKTPTSFDNTIKVYNSIVDKNNSIDYETQVNDAKEKLKLHYIKICLQEFNYDVKEQELKDAQKELKEINEKIELEKRKITNSSGIDTVIENIEEQIYTLIASTQNEEKLAININNKLKSMVSFELLPQKNADGDGYYSIKSSINNKIRTVEELSTGEKNIIAFLYFVEKLNEVSAEKKSQLGRIIIFDDPMNSNDDNMQYLIMSELLLLMKTKKQTDTFILLTHNKHFYINLTYGLNINYYSRFHLETDGFVTSIISISKKRPDFSTSYESLWYELSFLYNSDDAPAEMLLNPIRRILETFYKFNSILKSDFFHNNREAEKLFNVNSHSIDDFDAELNGKTKEQIIELMKNCFNNNNANEHFKTYWDLVCND